MKKHIMIGSLICVATVLIFLVFWGKLRLMFLFILIVMGMQILCFQRRSLYLEYLQYVQY